MALKQQTDFTTYPFDRHRQYSPTESKYNPKAVRNIVLGDHIAGIHSLAYDATREQVSRTVGVVGTDDSTELVKGRTWYEVIQDSYWSDFLMHEESTVIMKVVCFRGKVGSASAGTDGISRNVPAAPTFYRGASSEVARFVGVEDGTEPTAPVLPDDPTESEQGTYDAALIAYNTEYATWLARTGGNSPDDTTVVEANRPMVVELLLYKDSTGFIKVSQTSAGYSTSA